MRSAGPVAAGQPVAASLFDPVGAAIGRTDRVRPAVRWFVGLSINGTVSKNGKVRKIAVPPEVAASVGYAISQRLRKRIEEGFGWMKTVGGLAQVKARGLAKVRAVFVFGVAAYSLVRLPELLAPIGDVCLDG